MVVGDHSVPLAHGENLIGRAPWMTVTIDAHQVSRRHARIVVDGFTATLEDLGGKNRTYLNDRHLQDPVNLSHEGRIRLGCHAVVLQFVATA